MLTREELLDKLKSINPNYDLEIIGHAFDVANTLHSKQLRKSGEPYIIHPMHVAIILGEIGMDESTIVGGLLHDVVEDTDYTYQQVASEFGTEIADLVDGVTKLGSIRYESKEEIQAENFRKMFLAMSKDIRVLIIKLADRLHNMRTLEFMSPEKVVEKCNETLEIYAPLASRLGIFRIKFELEDLALMYLHPDEYEDLKNQVSRRMSEREETISSVINKTSETLTEKGIDFDIYGRAKHYYSIYKKMKYQNKGIDEIFDLMAVRVIVDTVQECYAVLGEVHTLWKPVPRRFKDYIAMPKPNMYQSLHTTVIADNGEPIEIQIRTKEMHRVAEYGIAAHWKYKEGDVSGKTNEDDLKLAWVRQSLEWQKDLQDPKDFLETMKMDLFASQVFVFTPKGDVIELPILSTPLDFAFKIHSDVGCKCVGAKVNGKMRTIDYTLQNGDIVEIVTSSNAPGPSPDWLNIAKSSNARNKIRNYLKRENKTETIEKGKEVVDRHFRKRGYDSSLFLKNNYIDRACKAMNMANTEELYVQLSNGGSLVSRFCNLLIDYYEEETKQEIKSDVDIIEELKAQEAKRLKAARKKFDNPGIVIAGTDNMMIKLARCCHPVPGDEIIGFITKGRGLSVHRCDCTNIKSLPEQDKSRLLEVSWEGFSEGKSYNTDITIEADDRKGLLSDISRACSDMDINLSGINLKVTKEGIAVMNLTLSIGSTQEVEKVIRLLKTVQSVREAYRTRS